MTDEWMCPYCGFVNPYVLHVARKDLCIKCKKEKKTWEDLECEYMEKYEEIDKEFDKLKNRAAGIHEIICSLENEIVELQLEKDAKQEEYGDIREEYQELKKELEELEKTKFPYVVTKVTETGKRILNGQKELSS